MAQIEPISLAQSEPKRIGPLAKGGTDQTEMPGTITPKWVAQNEPKYPINVKFRKRFNNFIEWMIYLKSKVGCFLFCFASQKKKVKQEGNRLTPCYGYIYILKHSHLMNYIIFENDLRADI